MRLGFSVRVLGRPGLRAYDGRRAPSSPHLSVSLAHLRDVFAYLATAGMTMYRMSPDLAPYVTHPDWPALHHQIDECQAELAEVGALARAAGLRLSVHAPAHVALASFDSAVTAQSTAFLRVLTSILDAMGLPAESVIVVHLGGLNGGIHAALGRWLQAWDDLPVAVRRRIAIEHEEDGLTLPAALQLHAATGVPVVFDQLHFLLHNPEGWTACEALDRALATWPVDVQPKVHLATQRTEMRAVRKLDPQSGRYRWLLSPPRAGHHADYLNVWDFARLLETAAGLRDFDVMLEAKAGDLALLRLREDIARYLPEVYPLIAPAEIWS